MNTANPNDRLIPLRAWIRIVVLGVLFTAFHAYVLKVLLRAGQNDPDWSHIFLVPFIASYIFYRRLPVLKQIKASGSWLGLILFAGGLVAYTGGMHLSSTMIMGYSMVMALFGLVWFFIGTRMMAWVSVPVLYLLFGIKFTYIYTYISMALQQIASDAGAFTITIVGLPLAIEADSLGALINIYHQGQLIEPALNVEQACSGLRSLMAMLAIAVALAFIDWRPWYSRLLTIIAALPVAVGVNVFRITITGVLY
ncbi:MAG: exosortase/archaeosortase family protein, partial [Lentisphaeria bacterium]